MKNYWVARTLVIILFLMGISSFYLKTFTNIGLIFLIVAALVAGFLNILNARESITNTKDI